MSQTFTLVGPPNSTFTARTQTSYTSDSSGVLTGVSTQDIDDAEQAGFKFAGNLTMYLPLLNFKTSSGVALPAAASSGIFGLNCVLGTGITLLGEATSSNSKTDNACVEFDLPFSYQTGSPFAVVVNCNYTSSGTTTSSTIVPVVYGVVNDSTQTANLVLTSAQTVTSSAADYTFTVNGAPSSGNLTAGTHIIVEITGVTATSSGSNTMQINSVRLNLP